MNYLHLTVCDFRLPRALRDSGATAERPCGDRPAISGVPLL